MIKQSFFIEEHGKPCWPAAPGVRESVVIETGRLMRTIRINAPLTLAPMRDKYRLRNAKSERGCKRSYGVTSDMEPDAKNFSRSKFSFDLSGKTSENRFVLKSFRTYMSSLSCLSRSATDMFSIPPWLAFITQMRTVATSDTESR